MALSLQEQLLKAGLADKKKAGQIKREKHKQVKQKQKHKVESVDEAKQAAEQARMAKAEKDRQLNAAQKAEADQKALLAQIRQLIEVNAQPKDNGDIAFNFTDGSTIKRLMVNKQTQNRLSQGKLAIVKADNGYQIVPMPVADKIAQRDESIVLYRADQLTISEAPKEEDDWYADYQIPDDLMW